MSAQAATLRNHGYGVALGLCLGVTLAGVGFTDFDSVHQMFSLADPRLFLTFIGAMLLVMAWTFASGAKLLPLIFSMHKGIVPGSLLFGLGWAVTGACPGVALVQLGEGKLPAVATLAGILGGTWIYPRLHRRFFRWDIASCDS